MKLSKAETVAVIITTIFVVIAAFFMLTGHLRDNTRELEMYIPTPVSGSVASGGIVSPAYRTEILININTATELELRALPGIGEVISQRIVSFRETHGPFTHISDILDVSGIGHARFEALKHLITVE